MTAPARRLRLRPRRTDEGRHWPLARIFGVVAGVAALLVVVAATIGVLSLARLNSARAELLDEIGPAVRTGQGLVTALVDQETGARGYELSRRDETLDPYRDGRAAEQDAIVLLRALSPQVPGLAANLDRVEAGVEAWRAGYAEPAIAAAAAGAPAGSTAPDRGRGLFDQVRSATTVLQADLERERLGARSRLDTASAFVTGVGVAVAVVALLFFVAAWIVLRRAVLRPMSKLAGQVRGVVSGDVGQQVVGSGPREIVGLGEDVEAMRVHILREVDALQAVNRRLDDQTRDLERSNRDLEQFAYVASHDLQEPLRKVASFCQLLQRRYGGTLDERADQYIGFAVDGAQRMQRLINDLLSFSRVGRATSDFTAVDLGAVATAAVDQQEELLTGSGGKVAVGTLPQVRGDRGLLGQLLTNLVGNALKFRREGVPPLVRVDATPAADPADGWEVAVADNGIGIEPEYADKVFVIFQRLHGRDQYTGTGIGLSLAKKIVEYHGGRIWIDVDPRREPGTTVRFTLPAAAATEETVAAAAEEGDG